MVGFPALAVTWEQNPVTLSFIILDMDPLVYKQYVFGLDRLVARHVLFARRHVSIRCISSGQTC